ncbi:MAG TPA: HlyD family efflux transporter periplasmic adaptor subunit [Pirellulales bacterium]|nr:HlyD family efflux transporter periplasmic adaptor subunit [Pirellulales bacterium]
MSTEQQATIDPRLIEQTKQHIRDLVMEIARLSKQDMTAREFYAAFLEKVVNALAAIGGAVWAVGEGGSLELQYQINLRETRLAENQQHLQQHGMLLQKTMSAGEGALIGPHSGEGAENEPANPTDFLLILGPVKVDQESKGIIEIFQRAGAPTTTQRGYLKFLLQMCELASDFLKTRQLRHFSDRQTLWNQLENFSRVAHSSLDPRETAYTIANEGRRLIECDRVSVAIRRGRKCTIEAVSGQDTFDKRSNVISLLNRLSSAVVATGDALWYSGDTSDLAPQVEDAVQAYVDESHSKHVAVLPLKRAADPSDEKDEPETIGALIVEQIEDARPREGMVQRVNVVCDHSSLALANAMQHNNLFLMPLWRSLGKASWVVSARTLPKTLAISAAVLAVLIVLVVWPVNFTFTSDGKLQPVRRREVFAVVEGMIDKILVKHGDKVQKGQVLMLMESTDLDVQIEEATGKLLQAQEGLAAAQRRSRFRDRRASSNDNEDPDEKARSEVEQYLQQMRSYSTQLELLREKKEKLKISSPIDGVVTTWDFEKELLSRPVKPGDALLTVADETSDWELELDTPEDRIGSITEARKTDPNLRVTYHLATEPGAHYEGQVIDVHRSAEVKGEEGNTVKIRVKIDKHQHEDLLLPGAGVKARLYCGRSSVGWWLFHDAFGFIESRVLFPLNL